MKKVLLLAAIALLGSCSTNYYQIYKTRPVSASAQNNVYENADCRISYDFWAEGGDAGFTIHNKSSEPLTVYMDESFYIVNGNAYDYYQARTFTTSKTETKAGYANTYLYRLNFASSSAVSNAYSTSYVERPEIIIPAKSSKSFREYKINLTYFAHCHLRKYPSRRKTTALNFGQDNSPFIFSNSITYSLGGKRTTSVHDFYVSEITNLPESEELRKVRLEKCNAKVNGITHANESEDNFYIKYSTK